jgi:hypothetical protein
MRRLDPLVLLLLAGPPSLSAPAEPPAASDAAAVAALDPFLTPEQRVHARFLEHLGWRITVDPVATVCSSHVLALPTLDSPGDLVVRVPPRPSKEVVAALGAALPSLADSVPTRLGWLRRLVPAVDAATRKLSAAAASGRYIFPQLLFLDNPFWALAPPQPEWVRDGDVWRASTSSARAIEAFYERKGATECYAAQILAGFAIQYELFGAARFDRLFRPEEVALGQPAAYHRTAYGRHVAADARPAWWALLIGGEDQKRDSSVVLARYGPLAFTGLTGIVRDQTGGTDCNENFTIVSISPAAVEEIRASGGFRIVAQATVEARDHHLATRAMFGTAKTIREHKRAIDAIFERPIFRDLRLYIHPYGVVPLAQIARKKILTKDASVETSLYLHGREDAFFRLYREAFLRDALAGSTAPPAARGGP